MISRVTAKDFLGLVDVDVELGPVTAFYGPNAAGKSSIVDVIRHVLSGKATRGGLLGELVRQGARSFEVEIADDAGFRFTRHRARSGNPIAMAEGVELDEKAYATEIVGHLGADAATIDSALRSGALLDLEPAALLRLLTDLCRAKLDAGAIRGQLGPAVVAAAEAQKIALPTSLPEFPACRARALDANKAAWARRDASRRALEAVQVPAVEIPAGMTLAAVEARLTALRKERDALLRSQESAAAYDAGARESKLASLRARIAELEAVAAPHPDARVLPEAERMVTASRAELVRVEADAARDAKKAEELRAKAAGETALPSDAEATRAALTKAEAEVTDCKRAVDQAVAEGKKRRALLTGAQKQTTCETCGHEVTPADVARLQERVNQAGDYYTTCKDTLEETEAEAKKLRTAVADLDARVARAGLVHDAAALAAKAQAAEERATVLRATVEQQEREVARLRPLAAQADVYRNAQADLQRVRAELAQVEQQRAPAAPTGSVADVEGRIATGESFRVALQARASRDDAQARVTADEEAVRQCDLVAKALGPGGAQAELVAQGMAPFLDAANAAFAQLAPDFRLAIDADDFGFLVQEGTRACCRPSQLSDGARTRLLYVLQYAVARLADVPLIALDRTELLDDAGKAGMGRLIEACEAEGIQVLAFSCRPAPVCAPPGKVVYAMQAGTARRVPGAVAA